MCTGDTAPIIMPSGNGVGYIPWEACGWSIQNNLYNVQYHSLGGQLTYICMNVCVCVCVFLSVCLCLNLVRKNATVILSRCFAFTFGVFGVYCNIQ